MSDRDSSPSRHSQKFSDEEYHSVSETGERLERVSESESTPPSSNHQSESESSEDLVPLALRRLSKKDRQKEILKNIAKTPAQKRQDKKKGSTTKKGATSKKGKGKKKKIQKPVADHQDVRVPDTVPEKESSPIPATQEVAVEKEPSPTPPQTEIPMAGSSKSAGNMTTISPEKEITTVSVPFETQIDGAEASVSESDDDENINPSPEEQRQAELRSKTKADTTLGKRDRPLMKNPEPKKKARVDPDDIALSSLRKKVLKKKVSKKPTSTPQDVSPQPTVRMTRGRAALAKVASKKSKRGKKATILIDDSESEQEEMPEEDVPDVGLQRTTMTVKLPLFRSEMFQRFWKHVCARTFITERPLNPVNVAGSQLMTLLKETNLLGTVLPRRSFVKSIVLEFYCNLSKDVFDMDSSCKHRTFIRGKYIDFSPQIIDEAVNRPYEVVAEEDVSLHLVATTLTGGTAAHWPSTGALQSSNLTVKYSILHKIAIKNWMPNSHRTSVNKDLATLLYRIGTGQAINFGQMVFRIIGEHAESVKKNKAICFPGLIYQIISSQVNVLEADDTLDKPPEFLVVSPKLFDENLHVKDVPGTSYGKSKSYGKRSILGGVLPKPAVMRAQSSRIIQELETSRNFLNTSIARFIQRRNAIDSLLFDLKHAAVPMSTGEGLDGEEAAHEDDPAEEDAVLEELLGTDTEAAAEDEGH